MKNSQMLNQFHKRDFLGYAFNFSLKFVFLSIGNKVKCYTRYTKHILVGYFLLFHSEMHFYELKRSSGSSVTYNV